MSEEERVGIFQAAAAVGRSAGTGVQAAPAAVPSAAATTTVSPAAGVARATPVAGLPEVASATLALKKELLGDQTATLQRSAEIFAAAGRDFTRISHAYEPTAFQRGPGGSSTISIQARSVRSSISGAAVDGRPSGSGSGSRAVQQSRTVGTISPNSSSSSTSDGNNRSGRGSSGSSSSGGSSSMLGSTGSSSSSSGAPSSVGSSSRRMPGCLGNSMSSCQVVGSGTSGSSVASSMRSSSSSAGEEGLLGSILEVLKDRYSVDSATLVSLKRAVAAAAAAKKTERQPFKEQEAAAGEQLRAFPGAGSSGAATSAATSSAYSPSASREAAARLRAATDAAAVTKPARPCGAARKRPDSIVPASGRLSSTLHLESAPDSFARPLLQRGGAPRGAPSLSAGSSPSTVGQLRSGGAAAAAARPRVEFRQSGQGGTRTSSSSCGQATGDGSSSTGSSVRSSKAAAAATLTTYEHVYNRFVVWVLACAEDSKDELMDVAFAVLLHMFRKLLSMGEPLKAWQLLSRCAYPHASRHKALLQQLEKQQVLHPLQLREVPYFSAAERHPLYISENAYQLLRSRLLETRSLLLEVMIQASVRLLPSSLRGQQPAPPRGLVYPVERTAAAATGQLHLPPQLLPQQQVMGAAAAGRGEEGLPEAEDARSAAAAVSSSSCGSGGGVQETKRLQVDGNSSGGVPLVFWGLPRQFCREEYVVSGRGSEKVRRVRVLGGENLRDSELVDGRCLLPLPEPNQEAFLLYRRVLKQQSERRMHLSAAGGQLPSIACISVLNASGDLSSCAISPTTSKMVALGGEGEIMLWNLQEYEVAKARREQRRRRRLLVVQEQQAQEGVCLSVSRALFSSSSRFSSSSSEGSSNSEEEGGGEAVAAGGRRRKTRSGRRGQEGSSSSGELLDQGKRRERGEREEEEAEESGSGITAGTRRLVGAEGRVLSLGFGELDDRILLSGGVDGVVRLWQSYNLTSWAAAGEETSLLSELQQEAELSRAVAAAGGGAASASTALSDRGRRLATYFHRKQRRLFADCCSTAQQRSSSSMAADQQQLPPSLQRQRKKRRLDDTAGSDVVVPLCLYRGGLAAVWSVDAGPYGHYFASGSSDGFARLWCTSRSFPQRLLPHPGAAAADVFHVRFHPNSSLLVTAAADACVRLFDLRTADQARCWAPGAAVAAAAAHQQQLLQQSSRRSNTERERRLKPQRQTDKNSNNNSSSTAARAQGGGGGEEEKKEPEKEGKAEAPAAKPTCDNSVPQRNIDFRVTTRRMQQAPRGDGTNTSAALEYGRGVSKKMRLTSVAVSPNGKLVAVSGDEGSICVYDIPTAKLLAVGGSTPDFPMAPATSLSFCRGSVLLAAACRDGTVSLFDTSTAGLRGPSLFSAETATAAVTPLRLVQAFGASHLAFRSCVFTPENLLVCLGISTLGNDTYSSL